MAVSETGGWCDAAVHIVHVTDGGLAGALAQLFHGRSVVGLGDGRGEYRRMILDSGHVTLYDAYDGAPNIYNITGGQARPGAYEQDAIFVFFCSMIVIVLHLPIA